MFAHAGEVSERHLVVVGQRSGLREEPWSLSIELADSLVPAGLARPALELVSLLRLQSLMRSPWPLGRKP
jgi:hypothetical protein